MITDDWRNLYGKTWKGHATPGSFSHPAKFSPGLIRRLYDHAQAEGWAAPGGKVYDPFAGVAMGARDAMRLGLAWVGCEIESDYAQTAQENIDGWARRYAALPGWGAARILHGDSRRLLPELPSCDLIVSSPPYADGCAHTGGADPDPAHVTGGKFHGVGLAGSSKAARYGDSPGQLAALGGADFWRAAADVVTAAYQVLRPGGRALWVVKSYVRGGAVVDFPSQWRAICEGAGFVTLHIHKAWLIEERPGQYDLTGELVTRRIERKSYYRRLAERQGSPPIDYEVVYCMAKA